MILPYTVQDINTRSATEVALAIQQLWNFIFEDSPVDWMQEVQDIEAFFAGKLLELEPHDTQYHDLEHTLQASLCFTRLAARRCELRVSPRLEAYSFRNGIMAALLHDVGYLKRKGDTQGTGAKYTFVHEIRSCQLASVYLNEIKGYTLPDILSIQRLISCTGPYSMVGTVPFQDELERFLGYAVRTADYLGQMSDPHYIEKLPKLFLEFQESDTYRGIPPEARFFKSADDLLTKTSDFWKNVIKCLDIDCAGIYKYLAEPYPDGHNPYLDQVEKNIGKVREQVAKLEAAQTRQAIH